MRRTPRARAADTTPETTRPTTHRGRRDELHDGAALAVLHLTNPCWGVMSTSWHPGAKHTLTL